VTSASLPAGVDGETVFTAGAGDSGRPEISEGITKPFAAASAGLRIHCRLVGCTCDDATSTLRHAGQQTLSETTSCSALLLRSGKASDAEWGTDRITIGIFVALAPLADVRATPPVAPLPGFELRWEVAR
jgi:hypothetical protein